MLSYQQFYTQKSNLLTLRKALEYHYQLNPQFSKWFDYPDQILQKTMKSHDIFHVVFGCDTTLSGEFSVELWTFFGGSLSPKEYYQIISKSSVYQEPLEIAKKVGYLKVLTVMLLNIWRLPYIFIASKFMRKKWPSLDNDQYLDTTLGQIRKDFGIKVLP